MEEKVGSNPSLTWRSICDSRNILSLGLLWRIGNGRTTRIAEDPWIPRPWQFKPSLLVNPFPPDATVNCLIDPVEGKWDHDMLQQHFWANDIEEIVKTPLVNLASNDLLVWHWTHNGYYSVSTGYHAQMKYRMQSSTGSTSVPYPVSTQGGFSRLWKAIWSLPVPNKVKIFGWRACQNIIPTMENLHKRKVSTYSYCMICNTKTETILHALRDCHFASEVWMFFHGNKGQRWCSPLSFKEWFTGILDDTDQASWGSYLMIMWCLWDSRNELVHKGKQKRPSEVTRTAITMLDEFIRVNAEGTSVKDAVFKGNGWIPPRTGNAKINVDAATFIDLKEIGIGVAIRDCEGEVLALLSKRVKAPTDPYIAESIALLEALTFALEIGIRNVEVEGDSLLTVRAVESSGMDHSVAGGIIEAVKKLIPGFNYFKLRHTKRLKNVVAHILAKHSKELEDPEVWLEETPVFLLAAINAERICNSFVPSFTGVQ
ncbi:hypothetical protein REPUB_Repub10bG0010000 [Reevesia pubescens]